MNEKSLVFLITAFLVVFGLFAFWFVHIPEGNSKFNFYKSELSFNGNYVNETLYYTPDKDYHTLYRNFDSRVYVKEKISEEDDFLLTRIQVTKEGGELSLEENYILIKDVKCFQGEAYVNTNQGCYFPEREIYDSCLLYTEMNEYGCGFGNYYGFKKNENYKIEGNFLISTENIFRINGKDYIKFIAYGRNMHSSLIVGKNLFISGNTNVIYDKKYPSDRYVIIYVPYTGNSEEKTIINLKDFEFDRNSLIYDLFILFLSLSPAIFFFFIWYFLGKKNSYEDINDFSSQYPKERKPWEVAAFFTAPFGSTGKRFFSSMLLNFYHKKVIDIKIEEGMLSKKLWIKVLSHSKKNFDEIEKYFLEILEYAVNHAKSSDIKDGFVNLNGCAKKITLGKEIGRKFKSLNSKIQKKEKDYGNKTGQLLFYIILFILFIIPFSGNPIFTPFFLVILILAFVLSANSMLMIKYKENLYLEYLQWKAFKKYLEGAPSIKEGSHKAVKIWDHYMIYALALGVSKKAIKELKNKGVIDEKQYILYTGISSGSHSFASSGGSGGGFGGAGGGGVGGGGGGGR